MHLKRLRCIYFPGKSSFVHDNKDYLSCNQYHNLLCNHDDISINFKKVLESAMSIAFNTILLLSPLDCIYPIYPIIFSPKDPMSLPLSSNHILLSKMDTTRKRKRNLVLSHNGGRWDLSKSSAMYRDWTIMRADIRRSSTLKPKLPILLLFKAILFLVLQFSAARKISGGK